MNTPKIVFKSDIPEDALNALANVFIANRNYGNGCPICINKVILPGYNDLEALNPKLALEWNYEKNRSLTPELFAANSGKKVWWKCDKGHEWQAIIASRNKGIGCPICAKERRKNTLLQK